MDIEERQAEHIEYFVKQASALKGSALTTVVVEATSHPSLFAFSEILAVPNILEVSNPIYDPLYFYITYYLSITYSFIFPTCEAPLHRCW